MGVSALSPALVAMVGGGVVAVGAAVWAWPSRRRAARERSLQRDIAEGRYGHAVPALLKQERYAEAARLEAWRAKPDRAAKLYERAGDMRGAASVYMSQGDFEMAALHFKEGGHLEDAADAFLKANRHETAINLLEQAGDMERALEICSKIGDRVRAAIILERMGRAQDGARILAERAQATGNINLAATQWELAGEPMKASEAWMRIGGTVRSGLLALEAGRDDLAVERFSEGGVMLLAGEVLRRAGKHVESARLLHQGGYLSRAAQVLLDAEEYVVVARLYVKHGHMDHAYRSLQRVPSGHPAAEDAHRMLVDLLHQDGRRDESQALLEGLIRRRMRREECDADVRQWVVQLSAILFAQGQIDGAIEWLRRLDRMDLDTPEMRERIAKLERIRDTGSVESLGSEGSDLVLPIHDRYVFEDVIGSGANGVIYRAHDSRLGRTVAIKMIGRTALKSEIALTFFLREAQTAAGLNHANIVTIYDIGEMEGGPFLAMELINGLSLAEILEESGSTHMTPAEALPIVHDLCTALDYAHREGVVHRDVKLENVMITEDGILKLMDFGLAKAMHQAPDKTLVITGTPLYMSPEQIIGRDVDHRTDIYAMGVLVFRLIVGTWPYADAKVLMQHRQDPIPKPSARDAELPPEFDEFIARAMAKVADERFDTAGQLALALSRCFP